MVYWRCAHRRMTMAESIQESSRICSFVATVLSVCTAVSPAGRPHHGHRRHSRQHQHCHKAQGECGQRGACFACSVPRSLVFHSSDVLCCLLRYKRSTSDLEVAILHPEAAAVPFFPLQDLDPNTAHIHYKCMTAGVCVRARACACVHACACMRV